MASSVTRTTLDPPRSAGVSNREHSLDAARGVLMVMGVWLHAAMIYGVSLDWFVSDSQKSPIFDALVLLIHEFRMQAFYWISGYFCAMTYEKWGGATLLRRRFVRIGVPLVTTWLTLNMAERAMLAYGHGLEPGVELSNGLDPLHLWFLIDLLIYIPMGTLLLSRFGAQVDRIGSRWRWGALPLLLVLTLGAYMLLLMVRMTGFAYIEPFGITQPLRLATYFPYFAVGMLMYRVGSVRRVFFTQRIFTMLAVGLLLCVAAIYVQFFQSEPGRMSMEGSAFLELLGKWMLVSGVIGVFRRWANAPNASLNFLADASYTIYLFHHVVVLAFGIVLLPLMIGPYLKFVLVTVATLIVTAAIHRYLIARIPVLRFLFNGRT